MFLSIKIDKSLVLFSYIDKILYTNFDFDYGRSDRNNCKKSYIIHVQSFKANS